MSKSITTAPMFQFDDEPIQPLPLQIASQYTFPLQYHQQSDDTLMYSVNDWIAGVAQTESPKRFDDDILKRAKKAGHQLYARRVKLPYHSSNSRVYQADFADDHTLYVLTQQLSSNTGIRNSVLEFLAQSGAILDEMRQDLETAQLKLTSYRQSQALKLGMSEAWITARELGVEARKQFTASLVAKYPELNVGEATNLVYKNMLGKDAAGLRETLNLGKKQNPRDRLPIVPLSYLMTCEASISAVLEGYADDDLVSPETVKTVIVTIATLTGKQAQETARVIGIDLITGQRLFPPSH